MSRIKAESGGSLQSYLDRGYGCGSILRVRMKNFLTYDDCEVFPGPKLNVVIGPNGTGKSAMTHAICLACAGTTGDIGRSSDLSKFVKQGKEDEECFVEVDILLSNGNKTTIRRSLNAEKASSKWLLNNKVAKLLDVKQLMLELSIDVDNLCSFMPQDRVGQFSQFTAKEVLQETLKSINLNLTANAKLLANRTSTNLYIEQQNLSHTEANKDAKAKEKDSKQAAYNQVHQQITRMSTEIDRLQERKRAIELKGYLQIKLLKVTADDLTARIKTKENELDTQQASLTTLRQAYGPFEMQVRDAKKQLQQLERDLAVTVKELDEASARMENIRNNLDDADLDVEKASMRITDAVKLMEADEARYKKFSADLAGMVAQYDSVTASLPTLKAEMDEIVSRQAVLQEQRSLQEDRQNGFNKELEDKLALLKAVDKEMLQLQDSKQVMFNRLKQLNAAHPDIAMKDCIRAMEFLMENEERMRAEGRLRGKVFGPAALHITTNDPAFVIMLEKAIPLNKLLGFVVMNNEDAAFLKRELRDRMKLKIDVYTMHNISTSHPRPYTPSYLNGVSAMQIQYLADAFQAPEEVRAYLYTFCMLHTVLWARGAGSSLTGDVLNRLCTGQVTHFKMFIHDPNAASSGGGVRGRIIEYSGRKSRYAAHLPPSTSSIVCFPRNILTSGATVEVDTKRNELAARKAGIQEKMHDLDRQLRAVHTEASALNHELLALKGERQKISEALRSPEALRGKIDRQKQLMADLKRKMDMEKHSGEAERAKVYAKAIEGVLKLVQAYNSSIQKATSVTLKKECLDIMKADYENKLANIENQLLDFQAQEKALKHAIDLLTAQKTTLTRDLQKSEKELMAIAAEAGGNDVFVREIYPKVIQLCPENTVEDVENRIIGLNAEINSIVDNPLLQQRYEEMQEEEQRLSEQLAVLNAEYEDMEATMRKRAEQWIDNVRSIANKLNKSFHLYMEKLGFQGEVALRETGRLIDYEMQLRVAFHSGSAMVDLSGQRHSGGERAVSTVMYLMALQDMTSAPFRVVDEINQGMDERNERLVMDRIVQTCCSAPSQPQYFLVSPKLLQGLQALDHEDVTVLLVWNGPGIKSKWRFEDVLTTLRKRAAGQMTAAGHLDDTDGEDEEEEKPRPKRRAAAMAMG